jgi:hypothetical protein
MRFPVQESGGIRECSVGMDIRWEASSVVTKNDERFAERNEK